MVGGGVTRLSPRIANSVTEAANVKKSQRQHLVWVRPDSSGTSQTLNRE